jgi:hypothetical protein
MNTKTCAGKMNGRSAAATTGNINKRSIHWVLQY